MADGRNVVDYQGVAFHALTGKSDGVTIVYDRTKSGGSAAVGLAVTLSADGTFALCADGDAVIGKLIRVEYDGQVSVQDEGGCVLPGGVSATLTDGTKIVGALGAASAKGYIRSAASGTAAELIKQRHLILASGTPTAVQVMLG